MTDKRGFRSYGELTLIEALEMADKVAGEWNGDESGKLEDRAKIAQELLIALSKVLDLFIELERE